MVILGNYIFLGRAVWQGKKSVSYITVHSADRMTWDENESYYLGDLHLLNQALFSKQFLKLNSGNYILPPHNLCPENMFCKQNLLFCGQNYVTSITDRFCPRSGGKLLSGGSERHKE